MSRIEYTNQPLPERDEFRRVLREAQEQSDPVEELLHLYSELGAYERQYGMTSAECHRRFAAGQLGDDPDLFAWVGRYKAFLRIKAAIAAGLQVVVNDPYAAATAV